MAEVEGVIQFSYALEPGDAELPSPCFEELRAWRSILRSLELLGEDPRRYGGYGFGNLSVLNAAGNAVITASQSSGDVHFDRGGLVEIQGVDVDGFSVAARGSRAPSSETLTHAMIYAADAAVRVVFHVHSPQIWRSAGALNIPATGSEVAYGTPAMAEAVAALMGTHSRRPLLFVTAGHEDGVFAAGETAADCGLLLVSFLARARALAPPTQAVG